MKNTIEFMPSFIADSSFIYVELTKFPKGHIIPYHWHDYYELEIILDGEFKHEINHDCYIASSGHAHLLTYYDFHQITALTDISLIHIQFQSDLLNKKIIDYLNFGFCKYNYHFSGKEKEQFFEKAYNLIEESNNNLPFSNIIVSNIMSELIISLMRKSDITKNSTGIPLIQEALGYINSHFKKDLSLSLLSEKLSVSSNYLGTLFKKHLGMSFNDYLNAVRLKYACSVLSIENLPLKEIALASGYNSVEYFLYIFKKNLSITPTEYRKQFQKNKV